MHDWWAQRPTQRECIYDHWDVGGWGSPDGGSSREGRAGPPVHGYLLETAEDNLSKVTERGICFGPRETGQPYQDGSK